jgi:hypothetical protein|tara:strand:+ start:3607 stop:4068 length:462 start_codon:yes stop_codon:yes gene_type:complete
MAEDWAMCNPDTGEVQYVMSINDNTQYTNGGNYNGLKTILIPAETDHVALIDLNYYDYSAETFESRGARPTAYYKWNTSKQWEVDTTTLMVDLRTERNIRLENCDWTQLADSPLSSEVKGYWVTYRQSLRDITKDLKDDLDTLDGFAWPAAPS